MTPGYAGRPRPLSTFGGGKVPVELTAAHYGIGARISLHPMTDRFVEVVLGALADVQPLAVDLAVRTGVVSTFVGGAEQPLLGYLASLVAAAARRSEGRHLAATVLLSRGCPGEVTCAPGAGPWASDSELTVPPTGVAAVAEWSLYPLLDGDTAAGDHLEPILAAVERARDSGLAVASDHYVTRLRGDVGAILQVVGTAWRDTGATVQHVTTHLNLSINSPTKARLP